MSFDDTPVVIFYEGDIFSHILFPSKIILILISPGDARISTFAFLRRIAQK
jgi:hypothetical protein